MMPDEARLVSGMNGSLLSQLFSAIPIVSLVLQGAATGALAASLVLVRARRRGLHVEPWAVTAAWSVLGAGVAMTGLVIAMVAAA